MQIFVASAHFLQMRPFPNKHKEQQPKAKTLCEGESGLEAHVVILKLQADISHMTRGKTVHDHSKVRVLLGASLCQHYNLAHSLQHISMPLLTTNVKHQLNM